MRKWPVVFGSLPKGITTDGYAVLLQVALESCPVDIGHIDYGKRRQNNSEQETKPVQLSRKDGHFAHTPVERHPGVRCVRRIWAPTEPVLSLAEDFV